MREKLQDIAKADIPGTDYYVQIEKFNRYGAEYEHIHRYNEWDAFILPKDETVRRTWELSDLHAGSDREAKADIEALVKDVFGITGELDWEDL